MAHFVKYLIMIWTSRHPLMSGKTKGSLMVQTLLGNKQEKVPVWFMRQAGRSLPEYRELRKNYSMLDSCLIPEVAAEITLQPVRRHGVDAAVFFSDIVIPLRLAKIEVDIVAGVGPVLQNPIISRKQFEKLTLIETDAFHPITEAIEIAVAELDTTPLLGFGGAPFTLASYLIEGKPSRDIPNCRYMMKESPKLWADILTWCADVTAQFLRAQIEAGASAIQLFDSWAGRLTVEEYEKYALPHSQYVFNKISDLQVPRIHFGVGTGKILNQMLKAGADVISVSNDVSISEAIDALGVDVPLQGNLDPETLFKDWNVIEGKSGEILREARLAKSHIFNLGHGVLPDTDPRVLTKLVDFVHDFAL